MAQAVSSQLDSSARIIISFSLPGPMYTLLPVMGVLNSFCILPTVIPHLMRNMNPLWVSLFTLKYRNDYKSVNHQILNQVQDDSLNSIKNKMPLREAYLINFIVILSEAKNLLDQALVFIQRFFGHVVPSE